MSKSESRVSFSYGLSIARSLEPGLNIIKLLADESQPVARVDVLGPFFEPMSHAEQASVHELIYVNKVTIRPAVYHLNEGRHEVSLVCELDNDSQLRQRYGDLYNPRIVLSTYSGAEESEAYNCDLLSRLDARPVRGSFYGTALLTHTSIPSADLFAAYDPDNAKTMLGERFLAGELTRMSPPNKIIMTDRVLRHLHSVWETTRSGQLMR